MNQNKQRMKCLWVILLVVLGLSRASSVNLYFDSLVLTGIKTKETVASNLISIILTAVRNTDWKELITDIDLNLTEEEKKTIIMELKYVTVEPSSTELSSGSLSKKRLRPRPKYIEIPHYFAKKYQLAFAVMIQILEVAAYGTEEESESLYDFFDSTFTTLRRNKKLSRETRLFMLRIDKTIRAIADRL